MNSLMIPAQGLGGVLTIALVCLAWIPSHERIPRAYPLVPIVLALGGIALLFKNAPSPALAFAVLGGAVVLAPLVLLELRSTLRQKRARVAPPVPYERLRLVK